MVFQVRSKNWNRIRKIRLKKLPEKGMVSRNSGYPSPSGSGSYISRWLQCFFSRILVLVEEEVKSPVKTQVPGAVVLKGNDDILYWWIVP